MERCLVESTAASLSYTIWKTTLAKNTTSPKSTRKSWRAIEAYLKTARSENPQIGRSAPNHRQAKAKSGQWGIITRFGSPGGAGGFVPVIR